MLVENPSCRRASTPVRCLDIITQTAHSTEVLHACAAITAVFHIIILPESILKGPI